MQTLQQWYDFGQNNHKMYFKYQLSLSIIAYFLMNETK